MTNPIFSVSALLLALLISSCATKPKGPEFDWNPQTKRMLDTKKNRQRYLQTYMDHVQNEAAGKSKPDWKNIFKTLDASFDNPELYKAFIVTERRKAGLPELTFVKKG